MKIDLKVGDRVECLGMPGEHDPVPVGTQGTVYREPSDHGKHGATIYVLWDNGRTLNLAVPPDSYKKLITEEA